mmetsp:Transcript_3053/g.10096  ORF Transcript_3053/g.10096 Transcript_3053/m.10096 type:complete len:259 (-) Transcript_3053:712-1488(-)
MRVLRLQLRGLHLRDRLDRGQTAVLRERRRHRVERLGERAHGVLLHARDAIRRLLDGDAAGDLRRAAAVHDGVRSHQVPRDADGVVQRPLRLIDHHLVPAAHEHGDRLARGAVLDDDHAVLRGSERHLLHEPRGPELLRGELLKPRDDPTAGRDRDELELDAADPANRRQLLVHQHVVRLVVEAPLANHERRAAVFALLHHVLEVLLLLRSQLFVLLHGVDVDLMLRLRLRGLERAGEDGDLRVLDLLVHLRVRDVLV